MKKLTATALVIAAGMAGSVQAADIEIDDRTTLSIFGGVELKYNTTSAIENASGDTESTSDLEDNGSKIGVGAEHRFASGLTGYMGAEFEYNLLGDNDDFVRDAAFAGLMGEFGDLRFGSFDNIYTEAIYDLVDPFETASLGEETVSDEDSMVAYFSPNYGGFSYALQARINGDRTSGTGSSEYGLAGVVRYTADRWAVHVAADDRGANVVPDPVSGENVTDEAVYGVGAALQVTDRLGLAARYSMQNNLEGSGEGDSTAFYGAALTYAYGSGDIYGAAQNVDPDEGDSQTQFALGINYLIEDNLYVYSEYGSYDPADTAVGDTDSLFEVGTVYEF